MQTTSLLPKGKPDAMALAVQQNPLASEYPQRTVNYISDSKIIVRSDFCSGNLAKACRGNQKNSIDLWVEQDAAPYIQGDFYKTWFYFSVTGVP